MKPRPLLLCPVTAEYKGQSSVALDTVCPSNFVHNSEIEGQCHYLSSSAASSLTLCTAVQNCLGLMMTQPAIEPIDYRE